jgi:hypothetical protein
MKEPDNLFILWTSGDREVAIETVFMYALNSKLQGWWADVELCIWGPSAKLAVNDEEINARLYHIINSGVRVTACKACTDHYDLSDKLEKMGIDVIYMGGPLTDILRSEARILTF